MNIKLEVSPISVNKSWKGRKFKTDLYKSFEYDVARMLPFVNESLGKQEVFVKYVFYINNYGNADTFNMEKTLSDMLVKRGYITDDRYIRAGYVRKERTDGPEWIDITIIPYTGQDIEC